MNGTLSLDDLNTSGNDDSNSTENNSGANSGSDDLREVCDELGADYEHACEYVDVHGKKDDLVEFARALIENDDLRSLHENYRVGNDIHRIILNWLRNDSGDFTPYTGAFYGDSDDPADGTYNAIQQSVRAEEHGNLIFYRALFPEPVAEYWDSEPVLWHEFDALQYSTDQDEQVDSHIYVTREWAEEYSDFTITVDGQDRPRPPNASELGNGGSNSGSASANDSLPFDPSDFTNAALEEELDTVDYSVEQLDAALQAEKDDKDRKGAKNALRDAKDVAEQSGGSSDGDSADSPAAKAGEMMAEGHAIEPDKVKELMNEGWTKDEIIEFYG